MNVEIFFHPTDYELGEFSEDGEDHPEGWYYWYCLPGCLPDSDPIGPFTSFAAAESAAKEELEEMRMQ